MNLSREHYTALAVPLELELQAVGCGVIGNTTDSGSVVLGSSPGTPAS